MKHLTPRKIGFGILLMLVLALGMQGTADAITKITKTTSTDYQVVSINQEFSITFSVGVTGARLKANHKLIPARNTNGDLVTLDRTATPYYIEDNTPGYQNESGVTRAAAHNHDEEAIAISSDVATLTLRKGSTALTLGATERSLSEDAAENDLKLLSSVTLKGVASAAGKYTITITDVTADTDFPNDTRPNTAPTATFTIYVWENISTTRDSTISGLSNGIAPQFGTVPLSVTLSGSNTTFARVEFEVTRGPGTLYEDKNQDSKADKRASNRLTTFTNNRDTASVVNVILMPNGGTSHVRAWVSGHPPETEGKSTKAIYSYRYAQLIKVSGDSPKQAAPASSRLGDPFVVQLVDSTGRTTIPGADITFTAEGGGFLEKDSSFPDELYADNFPTRDATTRESTSTTTTVETDSNGRASVFLVLGTTGDQSVTATFTGTTETFDALIGETPSGTTRTSQTIDILSGTDGQKADERGQLEKALIVVVRDQYGDLLPSATVEFEARDGGTILPPSPTKGDPGTATSGGDASGRRRDIETNSSGMASVRYLAAEDSGAQKVTATLEDGSRRFRTFTINGAPSSGGDDSSSGDDDGSGGDDGTVTVSVPRSVTGTAGGTTSLRVTAPATARVTIGGSGDTFPIGSASPGAFTGSRTSTLTLPSTAQTYTLTVFVDGTQYPVSVVATAAPRETGTVTVAISPGSGAPGTQSTVTVTARNTNDQPANVSVTLSLTTGGGTFANGSTTTTVSTGTSGTGTTTLTRGSTPGTNYFITATPPTGYTSTSPASGERLIVSGTQSPPTADTPVPRAAGEAAAVDVYDGDGQRGTPNVRLSEMLIVEVTDANGNPVSGERVTFRTTIGTGRFSPARPRTNGGGRAQTWFTPTSSGTIRISASVEGVSARAVFRVTTGDPPAAVIKVSGDSQGGTPGRALANPFVVAVQDANGETIEGVPVTFSVTAGGGRLSETSATTDEDGRAETILTLGSGRGINSVQASVSGVDPVTFNTSIEPEVLLAAANRPPMVWVDGGEIYTLVGASVSKSTLSADSVMNIAVSGNKIYWTEMTGENAGTINSANLDGTDSKQLVSIRAVPRGIAVDPVAQRLYWTNSHGWIQGSNFQGTRRQNVAQDLSDPMGIAVGNGSVYWTDGDGGLRAVNLTGTKTVRNISTGMDAADGVAVFGGKVYWTEMTGENAGTINAANLDGTDSKQLVSIRAVPRGIAVDPVAQRLYWTNSHGWIQSSNLEGRARRNVAKGLGSPGGIAVNANITETPATTPTKPTTPTTADRSKYDVNGDGSVDSTDTGLIVLAISTADTSAKYDVNGDGKVDFSDYLLVSENVDAGAAGAPSVFGMKMTAVQIERLQEQIDLLIASGDRSPSAMRALIYFQQLIATARPDQTQLLANYPNPFNPETWIPYELATDTDVRITIYNAQGVVIRTLQLGQQSAGYYTDRERAAYWDGRNAFGERVASGIYFYQLETDEMSALRKMVILK